MVGLLSATRTVLDDLWGEHSVSILASSVGVEKVRARAANS
jgi:hypothetical protein